MQLTNGATGRFETAAHGWESKGADWTYFQWEGVAHTCTRNQSKLQIPTVRVKVYLDKAVGRGSCSLVC